MSVSGGTLSLSHNLNVTTGSLVVVQIALAPQSASPELTPYGCLAKGATCSVLTSVTSPGLTFHQRMVFTAKPGSADETWMWEYYACPVPASGSISIAAIVNDTVAWSMIAYDVSGVDCASPFVNSLSFQGGIFANQTKATAPGDFNDCNLTDHCGITFSTTSNSLVVFGIGTQGSPVFLPPVSPQPFAKALPPSNGVNYTLIQQTGVRSWVGEAVSYARFTNSQVGIYTGDWILFNPTTSLPNGESAFWVVDAFQGINPVTTTSTSFTTISSSTTSSTTGGGGGGSSSSMTSSSTSSLSSTSTQITITSTVVSVRTTTITVMGVCTSGTFQYVNGTLTGKCAT